MASAVSMESDGSLSDKELERTETLADPGVHLRHPGLLGLLKHVIGNGDGWREPNGAEGLQGGVGLSAELLVRVEESRGGEWKDKRETLIRELRSDECELNGKGRKSNIRRLELLEETFGGAQGLVLDSRRTDAMGGRNRTNKGKN